MELLQDNDITFGRNAAITILTHRQELLRILAINPENRFVVNTSDTERFRIDAAGNILHQSGSPEYHFGTDSASHYNWRVAAQEAVDAGFEIASGTQSAGSGALSDTYTTRFVIKGNTGNVGIGTTSPASKLHIKNTASEDTAIILENTNNAQNLNIDYYNNAGAVQSRINYAEGPAAWNFIPNTSNSNSALYINYSANVGIGTTSPNTKLEVATSANVNSYSDGAIQVVSSSPIAFVAPSNLNPSLNRWGFTLREGGEGHFGIRDYRHTSTRVTIDDSGNVGIGPTSPSAKLHVQGTPRFELTNGGLVITKTGGGSSTNSDYMSALLRTDTAGYHVTSDNGGFGSVANALALMNHGDLILATAPATGGSTNYPSGRIMIKDTGNVGIGTASPETSLHVSGKGTFENAGNVNRGNLILGPHGSGASKWATLAGTHYNEAAGSGNGSGNAGIMIIGSHAQSGSNQVYIGHGPYELNPATHIRLGTHTADTHNLGGTTHMIIDSAGKVGIGTTSPTSKLHVNYGVNASVANLAEVDNYSPVRFGSFRLDNDDNLYFMSVGGGKVGIQSRDSTASGTARTLSLNPYGGNVGIGITAPGATLHVDPATNVTTNFGAPLIKVGGDNSWAGNGSIYSIGFGYVDASISNKSPAEIGLDTTSNAGYTKGDLVFALRDVTTNTAPTERMRIGSGGSVGIGTDNPDCKLSVDGTISSGTTTKPTHATYDSGGNMRSFEHHFTVTKGISSGTAVNATLVDISGLGSFHQASFVVEYGTRLQAVSDSNTGTVVRTYGVNRFNSGSCNLTETNAIAGSSNSLTHALVTVEVVSNTQYRLRVEFSSTVGASSMVSGVIRGYGVGGNLSTVSFSNGMAGS